jgi:23S rRNA (guanine2535-N1)-methyltransferase
MEYIYEKQRGSYEDFASGRVLLNARGTTAFPVKLASEIFLRGRSYLRSRSDKEKYSLFDPCCGGAHLLTTIGILNGQSLNRIVGSDIDDRVIEIAKCNLSMVNQDGIQNRLEQIKRLYYEYGKESHWEAIGSAERLKQMILERRSTIELDCFQADATDSRNFPRTKDTFDIVITDLPYGEVVAWRSAEIDPANQLLENLLNVISSKSVVIIVCDKKQVINHPNYNRLEQLKIGKRKVFFLEPRLS